MVLLCKKTVFNTVLLTITCKINPLPWPTIHYALTIRTAHFSLKSSDYKNLPNHGHWPCLRPSWDPNHGPHAHLPTLGLQPGTSVNLWYLIPNPCSIYRNCQPVTCFVYKVSVYTDSIKTAFKAVLPRGITTFNTVLCLRGTIYGIKKAPNSRPLFKFSIWTGSINLFNWPP